MQLAGISKPVVLLSALLALVSCGDSAKLSQSEAENAIRFFIAKNSYRHLGRRATFKQETLIYSTEPIRQFNEAEASTVVHFNAKDAYAKENLALKFIFKRDLNDQWVLTAVEGAAGVGSQRLSDKVRSWKDLHIVLGVDDNMDELRAAGPPPQVPPTSTPARSRPTIGTGTGENMNAEYLSPSDPEKEILKIRREYQRLNSTQLRKESYDWSSTSCGAGTIRYDFEGDRIVRVIVNKQHRGLQWTEEYYYYGDGTFFFSYVIARRQNQRNYTVETRTYTHKNYIFRQLEGANKRDVTPYGKVVVRGERPYLLIQAYESSDYAAAICSDEGWDG